MTVSLSPPSPILHHLGALDLLDCSGISSGQRGISESQAKVSEVLVQVGEVG